MNLSALHEFLMRYNSIKKQYEKESELWHRYFFNLTPADFILTVIIFIPGAMIAFLFGNSEGAYALLAVVVFEYVFGYFPYYRELPTYKNVMSRIRNYKKLKVLYRDLIEEGNNIANSHDLVFSDKGYFYTEDKKYRIDEENGKITEHNQ